MNKQNKTNQIRTYTEKESCACGIKGWYYTENKNPIPEVEWRRWV
jgi:hypothetical protein